MWSPDVWRTTFPTVLLQTGDYTANRQFVKIKNAYAARAAIFAKWAFGGAKAHFAKLQFLIAIIDALLSPPTTKTALREERRRPGPHGGKFRNAGCAVFSFFCP